MFPLLLWAVVAAWGYYCVQHRIVPLEDLLEPVAAPWPFATGFIVLCQYYEDLIRRITYIGILFYWYIFISHTGYGPHQMFSSLLMELMRPAKWDEGPTDGSGRHWTLNIAEQFLLLAFGVVTERFWTDHYWKMTLFTMFLTIFVLGNHVFHLWMQKQIARLTRWNRHAWTWRDLIIEYALQSLIRKLDSPLSRSVMRLWWRAWFWYYNNMTNNQIRKLSQSLILVRLLSGSSILLDYSLRWLFWYSLWLKELVKFSNPDPPPYTYEALKKPDHIRILLLHPTFGFRPISCNLVQGPHMRRLNYEAISYTWGGMEATRQIMVDGCTMKVTESVYEILTTYCSLLVPKLLWIDAVCIDQQNVEEKSLQVPLMQKIYREALFTTVFLGRAPTTYRRAKDRNAILTPYRYDGIYAPDSATQEHNDSACAVFDLFNEFEILKSGALRHSVQTIYELYETLQPTKSKPKQWDALLRLLQHPWFGRVWVVQEVALSQRVFVKYGDETIDWDVLASGLARLHRARNFRLWLEWTHGVHLRHIQHTSMYNVLRIDKLRSSLYPRNEYGRVTWPTVPQLLSESFYFRATNPRDQIFGLMALTREPLAVDYTVSVEDTFINAAKALLKKGSIGILLHAGGVGNRSEAVAGLPTWVPDWRSAPPYDALPSSKPVEAEKTLSEYQKLLEARIAKLRGAKEEVSVLEPEPEIALKDERTLSMKVRCIDTIASLGPVVFDSSAANAGGTMDEMHMLAERWHQTKTLVSASPYITNGVYAHTSPAQPLSEALYRTLLCGKTTFGYYAPIQKYLANLARWEANLAIFLALPKADTSAWRSRIYTLLESMNEVTEEVERCCGGRRVFVTQKGYLGICPPGTRSGDEVCGVRGVGVSVLLRRKGWGKYELVGEGYCHGVKEEGQEGGMVVDVV